jgi:hypothetical protein
MFVFYRERKLVVKENLPPALRAETSSAPTRNPLPKREGQGFDERMAPVIVQHDWYTIPLFLAVSQLAFCLFVEDSVDVPFAVKNPDNINSERNDLVEDQHLFETGDRPLSYRFDARIFNLALFAHSRHIEECFERLMGRLEESNAGFIAGLLG